MLIPLKRKYRPREGDQDYYGKKQLSTKNDSGKKRHRIHGDDQYDPKKHVLWVYPNGKRRMVHYV